MEVTIILGWNRHHVAAAGVCSCRLNQRPLFCLETGFYLRKHGVCRISCTERKTCGAESWEMFPEPKLHSWKQEQPFQSFSTTQGGEESEWKDLRPSTRGHLPSYLQVGVHSLCTVQMFSESVPNHKLFPDQRTRCWNSWVWWTPPGF